jgi:hypothetical protein
VPNNASPPRGGSPAKRGFKRKSPSQGLGGVLCPCWEVGYDKKYLDESSNGGNRNSHGSGRDQASAS